MLPQALEVRLEETMGSMPAEERAAWAGVSLELTLEKFRTSALTEQQEARLAAAVNLLERFKASPAAAGRLGGSAGGSG